MPDHDDDPPASSPGASGDDEDAPASESRPSRPVAPAQATPPGSPGLVTPELVRAFIGLKSTQARIRHVAVARLGGKKARADDVDEVIQATSIRALTTPSLPGAPEGLRPWISTVTAHAAIDHLRRAAVRDARFGTEVDVEELPPDPIDAPDEASGDEGGPPRDGVDWEGAPAREEPFMVGPWVEREIAKKKVHKERDELVLEMIRYKASHPGISDAKLAATFGMTPAAYESRVRRFRNHYVPIRQRYVKRQRTLLLVLLLGVAVAVIAWLVWPRHPPADIGPDPEARPLPSAAPTASGSVGPERFNQALPPDDSVSPEEPPKPK